jgi:hypothetical protein
MALRAASCASRLVAKFIASALTARRVADERLDAGPEMRAAISPEAHRVAGLLP